MPVIKHRTGPLAGTEQTIDARAERITFGRDPAACDVVFPPDLTLVSRRHFALLRKPSGEWTFDLFGDPYVAVNGVTPDVGQAVHSGAVVELGKKGGPSFEIVTEGKELDDALPVTSAQQKVKGSHQAAAQARNWALAGVAIAVLAVGGTGTAMYLSQNQGARLDKAVASLTESQEKAAAESIGAPVREKLQQAAYVVLVRFASGQEAAQGTASPIAPDKLATNAHVVDITKTLGPGDKMMVRAPGPNGKVYEVIATQKHPGYDAFNAYLAEDPIFVVASKDCEKCFPPVLKASLSYDVGILQVAPDSNLGPVLEIATPEELNKIAVGMPLALAGYPLENISGSEVQAMGATPTFATGMVTANTDMFNLPSDPAYRRLVRHNLPVTGGNSGSPMVAPSGKLVALLNSGNVLPKAGGGRMPNAAQVNYAQRADLLLDLLSGKAEANLPAERAYWEKQTSTFKRGIDVIIPAVLKELSPPNGATPVMANQTKGQLTSAEQFKAQDKGKEVMRRQKSEPVKLKSGQRVAFIAYAQDKAPIQLYLVVDNKIIGQDDRGNWFPTVAMTPTADTDAQVYVVGGDADIHYTFMEYVWNAPPS